MPSLNDIRATFLDHFARHDHQIVPSSPLVPRNDPTLMFVNSGMVQFKSVFTGAETRDYKRAATAQKCVRAGGKHNDLDNVGYTARHHTFFEMLGNFSFGDYFKEQALVLAWELITKEFGLDPARLLSTVYHSDDEAFALWLKLGLPESRIIRIASADNFWQMGPTGPCGPCSEIFYDHGAHIAGGRPGSAEQDGDRFIEIWNIVFMQNEQFEDGSMVPLAMQSIDTGMGLERIGALLQGSHDNYATDLMQALIMASAEASHTEPFGEANIHHRVIADHLRSASFLIADGVMPANEGRGYVLRRIMRRAMRHAHLLGGQAPLMHRLVPALVRQMGAHYGELVQAQALIAETLSLEETRFRETLARGLRLLEDETARLADGAPLPGEVAFRLYDTYGFPPDLTEDALRTQGRAVDMAGFEAAMAQQKARARAAWVGADGGTKEATLWFDVHARAGTTDFLGYSAEHSEGQILALVSDGAMVDRLQEGDTGWVITNQTPFYGESGGQVGDTGLMRRLGNPDPAGVVVDTAKCADGQIHAHKLRVQGGVLRCGDDVELRVDAKRRAKIRANHSATHLLHEALRETLGDHVAQRGSLNAPDRLRLDFTHPKALTPEELHQVDSLVNAYIRQNSPVETHVMSLEAARAIGARALFGEKYGDELRVVSMGRAATGRGKDGHSWSIELCGGTHVRQTGEIGVFATLGTGASSAGVRRIEALTAAAAFAYLSAQDRQLAQVALQLRTRPAEVPARIQALLEERRALHDEIAQLRRVSALGGTIAPEAAAPETINGVAFLAQSLSGVPGKDLPALIDAHKQRLVSGVVVLISQSEGKLAVATGVSSDLTSRVSAVALVRAVGVELGGTGGGGRADMAQGGGKDAARIPQAVAAARRILEAMPG
ncbi:MAG: alanine--tRNA ligase [Rhodobacteraceae bacterium]|nr:alanine--tRNA ligase [Paracoccaceae bacterium]